MRTRLEVLTRGSKFWRETARDDDVTQRRRLTALFHNAMHAPLAPWQPARLCKPNRAAHHDHDFRVEKARYRLAPTPVCRHHRICICRHPLQGQRHWSSSNRLRRAPNIVSMQFLFINVDTANNIVRHSRWRRRR